MNHKEEKRYIKNNIEKTEITTLPDNKEISNIKLLKKYIASPLIVSVKSDYQLHKNKLYSFVGSASIIIKTIDNKNVRYNAELLFSFPVADKEVVSRKDSEISVFDRPDKMYGEYLGSRGADIDPYIKNPDRNLHAIGNVSIAADNKIYKSVNMSYRYLHGITVGKPLINPVISETYTDTDLFLDLSGKIINVLFDKNNKINFLIRLPYIRKEVIIYIELNSLSV